MHEWNAHILEKGKKEILVQDKNKNSYSLSIEVCKKCLICFQRKDIELLKYPLLLYSKYSNMFYCEKCFIFSDDLVYSKDNI